MQATTKSIVMPDGNTVEFPRLYLEDLLAVAEALKAEKVAAAKRLAAVPEVKPEFAFNLLVSAENIEFGVVEIWYACNNPKTAKLVLLKSLKRAGKDSEIQTITAGMDGLDVVELAQDLVSEQLRPKDDKKQDDKTPKSFKKSKKDEQPADGANPT